MSSRDYWKRRSLNLEQLLHTRAEKTVRQITGLYDKAQEHIVEQIEKTFSAYVKGGTLNEQKANQLLTVRETEEAREALREQYQTATGQVKRDIWARLSAPAYANRISRLQALRDDIYAQARRVGLSEVEYVSDRLNDTLEQSYYRTIFDVEQYTGEGYRFDLLGDNQITAALSANWSGKNWSDRLWDNNQRFADAVEETVAVGILAGLRYDEMRDNLLHVVGLDDTEGAKYNARRLVMTECNYVANQGHLMGYKAAGIEYYIYLATLDLRTSEICRKLDGQRFPVDEAQPGTNLPPMHPHCRSTTMCDMSRAQLNRVNRAARDPITGKSVTIPGYMTYREWYEKYVSGNPQAEANEKKIRNQSSDKRQFAEYQQVLGENAPKTFADFQQMKYTDSEAWDALKLARQDTQLQADIRAGKYDLTINPEKQARHILGSDGYIPGRSYLTITGDELQELVKQYAGTGTIQRTRDGRWKNIEIVSLPDRVGYVVKENGTVIETNQMKIHYSTTGTHVVPFWKGDENQ
ncbi:MAG: minor capsid protein [Clostridiales bacterium]|nr:minor capsid protein [Clostridiales bacterium]